MSELSQATARRLADSGAPVAAPVLPALPPLSVPRLNATHVRTDGDMEAYGRQCYAAGLAARQAASTAAPTLPPLPITVGSWTVGEVQAMQLYGPLCYAAGRAAAPALPAAPAESMTDDRIEDVLTRAGFHWNGDQWQVEDADFYPAARALIAAAIAAPAPAVPASWDQRALLAARTIVALVGQQPASQWQAATQCAVLDAMRWVAPAPAAAGDARWLPMADAPLDGTLVAQACWFDTGDESGWINASGDVLPTTHWMPLPAAPHGIGTAEAQPQPKDNA
jgi:hypothetical protein